MAHNIKKKMRKKIDDSNSLVDLVKQNGSHYFRQYQMKCLPNSNSLVDLK
uniref:Uncharacterized protein n=1 Tax=Octopus bimaculoides TaxID=37653 RepID=A0A0L8H3P0_OCTBM